jgi:hypothetical protein
VSAVPEGETRSARKLEGRDWTSHPRVEVQLVDLPDLAFLNAAMHSTSGALSVSTAIVRSASAARRSASHGSLIPCVPFQRGQTS